MRVTRGRHKGVEMIVTQTGPDWVSARWGGGESGTPTDMAVVHPLDIELDTDEYLTLGEDPANPLWVDFEGYPEGAHRFRLRAKASPPPRPHVYRIADA